MNANSHKQSWCEVDNHLEYEKYSDFNDWIDEEAETSFTIPSAKLGDLSQKSKALFTGDRAMYNQVFEQFRAKEIDETFASLGDEGHWSDKNKSRFNQLISALSQGDIVPFVGAGLSSGCGFPTWKEHLIRQGKIAGMPEVDLKRLLQEGQYEAIIAEITNIHGKDGFKQHIMDDFFEGEHQPSETMLLIAEISKGMVVTTNYDHMLEVALKEKSIEKFTSHVGNCDSKEFFKILMDDLPALLKLHGDVSQPRGCILGEEDYDIAYGETAVDMNLNLPKNLINLHQSRSLLFVGCSLANDRTMHVFFQEKKRRDEAGEGLDEKHHFAIVPLPKEEADIIEREKFLLAHGIRPIWFPDGDFSFIEKILSRCLLELQYRGISIERMRDKQRQIVEESMPKLNLSTFAEASAKFLEPFLYKFVL
ncbi:hypothetical protein MTBPR1_140063 [Candidatus Terasakiella magnetica]|uniref:Uncharacterized protein n=1 Tax=Candidatus Terasakiella magnetica TaxID=1867952 RepID=A0A1C3RFB4_9PROT|nr:SIR2 family protein [Candidatus Terasakiella magnetica]SCA55945.1 hypothetical protein MTBPR1_140063 [Candidatus Terasakiella magnetica]